MFEPDERPPIATNPISVILTAYNAAAYLEKTIDQWVTCLESLGQDYELLHVDDGSTDQTGPLAEGLTRRHARLCLLRHPVRRGFGAALGTGLEAARHPLVCYTLCGSQYQASDMAVLLKWIDKVDLVCGYRVQPSAQLISRLGAYGCRLLLRLTFALRVRDPGCIFVLARRAIFRRIPLQSTGLFAHAEVLAKANFLGCLMTDAPATYSTAGGETHATRASFKEMWTEAWRLVSNPNFGPAFLPEDAPWCADWARSLSRF
ncbi:MAG TPA: glycosyltransferase family 2 protein [Gemmataceae bacterium]|jgi:glycosyltransferase involved in cell wall biosynthesis|nr:glycosyltransferase family 2 protein [Gemmataceae bacterium]